MTNNQKKKALIFAVAYHPFVGGAEVAVQEITKRLAKDFEFHLITLRIDGRIPKSEKIDEVFVYRIGWGRREGASSSINLGLTISKYFFPFLACLKAIKLHKKHNFDFTWSIMASYSGFAALFFKFLNRKIPFVLTLQEGDPIEHIKRRVGIFMPLYKKIFSKADIVQTISNFLADFAKKYGYKKEPIVVSNGVDLENFSKEFSETELFSAKEEIEKKEGDIFLITSSRLVYKNAVDQIIKALSHLPKNFNLLIAGEGEERQTLEDLAEKLSLKERVKFLGVISHQKLPLYLKVSDIFIRPSRSEGMGNSFIEAMASGIPVIGTPVGGIPDFLEDEKTGLFCEVDNPEDIAKQVKRLIEDNKLRQNIVENAREMVAKDYSWGNISQKMKKEVFDGIL